MEAVSILAETIASLAQAHAEGDPDRTRQIWEEAARRIGWDVQARAADRDSPPPAS
jgi:hypothetical protein